MSGDRPREQGVRCACRVGCGGCVREPLPTYPFQRQRHWIEAGAPAPAAEVGPPAGANPVGLVQELTNQQLELMAHQLAALTSRTNKPG